jgi:hypothetical protein
VSTRVKDLSNRLNDHVTLDLMIMASRYDNNIDKLRTSDNKSNWCYLGLRGKDVDNSAVSNKNHPFIQLILNL